MGRLLRFFWQKSIRLVTLLFAVSTVAFTMMSLSPLDPIDAYVRSNSPIGAGGATAQQREVLAARWGLNDPPVTRYVRWLGQVGQGNLGNSIVFNQPVIEVIRQRFTLSVALLGVAWVTSGLLGFTLGVLAAAWRNSWFDQAIRLYAYVQVSTPVFWMGLLLLMVFAVWLDVAPTCCAWPIGKSPETISLGQRLHHMALPILALSVVGVADVTLYTRQKLIDVLQSNYALFARSQGERQWGLIGQHGLRNIALPAITLQCANFGVLFGGSLLTEQIFAYPGLGEATVTAAQRGDTPLLLGITLFSAVFVFTGNTIADLAYQLIDPRVRLDGDL